MLPFYSNAEEYCFKAASIRYQVSEELLRAIALVESSGNPSAINKNKASEDIGLMQINSWWLPKLKQYKINRDLLFRPCTSIMVGAWILSGNIKRLGYNWQAVGEYNSQSPAQQAIYTQKIYRALKTMRKE